MRLWVRNASFLLLASCTLGNLGFLGTEIYRLLAFLAFLVFVSTFGKRTLWPSGVRLTEAGGAILLGLIGLVLSRLAPLGDLYLYFFLAGGLFLLRRRGDSMEARQLGTYVAALGGVGFLAEAVRMLPILWHLQMGVAALLSSIAATLAGEDRNLGPTAMGIPLLGSLFVLASVREAAALRRRPFRWAIVLLVLLLTHLFYLVVLKYYARWIATRLPSWEGLILNSQHIFLLLGVTAFTLLDRGRAMGSLAPLGSLPRRTLWGSLGAMAGGVLAVAWLGGEAQPERKRARVMIYDGGYANWNVPVHGKYGELSAGMFGMLPSTLEAVGFDVVVSNDLRMLEGPEAPDCVIMINIQDYFEGEDKEAIWKYVHQGGGLLCLGDHTGVAGIRGPFNELLQPVGIRFLFDSSTFFGNGWNEALELRTHPMNRGVRSAEDFQIWVGATLDLDLEARPVIVGRYGYSDMGDPANIERSYLGNRRYDPDELLGDVVLAADARHGRGKVLVFGDTSGYQNLSLARTLETVARSVDFLSGRGGAALSPAAQVLALALLLALLLGCLAYTRALLPIAAVTMGLALGSAAVRLATPIQPPLVPRFLEESPEFPFSPTPHVRRDLAVLDRSHGGRFTLRAWENQSIGGLQLNLARNGYFLLIQDEFPREFFRDPGLLLLLSPVRPYSSEEVVAIEQFLERGGKAIVTVGFEELDGTRGLLRHFGLSVANLPLGRLVVRSPADTLPVEFHEAWPLRHEPSLPVEVLLREWDLPLAVRLPVGKGELVLIGDSSFFHDVNLETREIYLAGNVAYLRRMTEDWRAP